MTRYVRKNHITFISGHLYTSLFKKKPMRNMSLFNKKRDAEAIVYRIITYFFLIQLQYICIHSCNTFTTIHLHSTHLSYLLPFISTERESDDTHTHTHTAVILFKSLLYVFHVANNLVNVILVGRGSCCLRGGWSKKYTWK